MKVITLPIIGDDINAQLGATITDRTLDLFTKQGVKVEPTYPLERLIPLAPAARNVVTAAV